MDKKQIYKIYQDIIVLCDSIKAYLGTPNSIEQSSNFDTIRKNAEMIKGFIAYIVIQEEKEEK